MVKLTLHFCNIFTQQFVKFDIYVKVTKKNSDVVERHRTQRKLRRVTIP